VNETLKILKMRVGMVIVAKLRAHTNIRVTKRIREAIKWNIQPMTPCEEGVSTGDIAGERMLLMLFMLVLKLERVMFSAMAEERVSVESSILVEFD
jgi:hypothetical protein